MEDEGAGIGREEAIAVQRKIFLALAVSALLAAGCFHYILSSERKSADAIRLGIADDCSGLALEYLVREKSLGGAAVRLAPLSIKDCCAGNTQWAFSAEELDIAVMCPDAAAELVKKDSRYQIIGGCTMNTDILVWRAGSAPKMVGVAQNRPYQRALVQECFADAETASVLVAGLPYAYEKGLVDGVVVDVLKSLTLEGHKTGPGIDRLTSVLVMSRAFKDGPRYEPFMAMYAQTIEELNQPEILRRQLSKIKGIDLRQEDMDSWKQFRIRFLYPLAGTTGS